MRKRRTTHIELPVEKQIYFVGPRGQKLIDSDEDLVKRLEELFQALRCEWQRGYEQCLVDNDIDPETYVQPTRAPWS